MTPRSDKHLSQEIRGENQGWMTVYYALLLTVFSAASVSAANAYPIHTSPVQRVVVLGLDGLSRDGLMNAATPSLDALRAKGAFIPASRGVMPSMSAPNWSTLLTSVGPSVHGIHSNQWWWFRWTRYLEYPTFFTALKRSKQSGAQTAAVYEWKHFGRLWDPKDVDFTAFSPNSEETIEHVRRALASRPRLMVIHLVGIDRAGHQYGWGSDEYDKAVTRVDAQVGSIVDILREQGLLKDSLLVVVSDHGGAGRGHGGDSDMERQTPAILYGRTVKPEAMMDRPISSRDIARTIHSVLRLPTVGILEGQPLSELFFVE